MQLKKLNFCCENSSKFNKDSCLMDMVCNNNDIKTNAQLLVVHKHVS